MPAFDRSFDRAATCPACAAVGLEHFYQVEQISTSSNLLMPTRQEAIDWPRGDLRLAYCAACGFICNTAFDPSTQQLTGRYEATQACSPTFGSFARKLAQDWIDRYQLRGKQLLEIGCGQGEFIAMMCELADATGWGIDPIVDRARAGSPRVQFLAEKYDSKHADLAVDFVVCRHTLEHICAVRAFLSDLMHGIGGRSGVTLAIEVPDNQRVMNETAFWDIYYEHCSYFDSGALVNALRSVGFATQPPRLEFGGQYLIVESTPTAPMPVTPPESSPIEPFIRRCRERIGAWRQLLNEASHTTILWGSGSKAVGFLTTLNITHQVAAVVDINPAKQGTFLPGTGHEIISPDRLLEMKPSRVIVMNPVYENEIRAMLETIGVTAEVICLM